MLNFPCQVFIATTYSILNISDLENKKVPFLFRLLIYLDPFQNLYKAEILLTLLQTTKLFPFNSGINIQEIVKRLEFR